MDELDFLTILTEQIMAQGYDRETAGKYAVLIGDRPILDEAGKLIVMDGDQVIATLEPPPMFKEV